MGIKRRLKAVFSENIALFVRKYFILELISVKKRCKKRNQNDEYITLRKVKHLIWVQIFFFFLIDFFR